MSKTFLLSEKYNSVKGGQSDYKGKRENIKASVSNSFIKKHGSHSKTGTQPRAYTNTMPLSYNKKFNEAKANMDASVALPKIVKYVFII